MAGHRTAGRETPSASRPAPTEKRTGAHAAPEHASTEKKGILSGIQGALVAIGATAAGVTAILHVCGYLVTSTHIYALGLKGLVDFDKDYFLLEGANFFLAIATNNVGNIVSGPAIVLLMAMAPFAIAGVYFRGRLASGWNWVAKRYEDCSPSLRTAIRFALYCVMLVTAAVIAFRSMQAVFLHLQISDVLYRPTPDCNIDPLPPGDALLCGDRDELRSRFDKPLWSAVGLIVLAATAWRLLRPWKRRVLLVAPLVFLATFLLLLLPMDFGVLLKPTRYPLVQLQFTEKGGGAQRRAFLIDRNDRGYTVWVPSNRMIEWIPAGDVAEMDTIAVCDLFASPRPAQPEREKGHAQVADPGIADGVADRCGRVVATGPSG